MRLRRSDPRRPGYRRRRAGNGFRYLTATGRPVPAAEAQRCRDLAIPPAWNDVWICPDPAGHLQATGVDEAGRTQYLYHPQWRRRRDRRKFGHVRDVAGHLPTLRRRIGADLGQPGLDRRRVLALAARLLDRGLFRVGGERYPTFGVATLRANHVTVSGDVLHFRYPAKGGLVRECCVRDRAARAAIAALLRERSGRQRLLAFRDGRAWRSVRAADINEYLREASGTDMSAKDLRTWHGTVIAARAFAAQPDPTSPSAAQRAVAAVMKEVAEELGNTPAVARRAYVDPVVVEEFTRGATIGITRAGPAAERAVQDMLAP